MNRKRITTMAFGVFFIGLTIYFFGSGKYKILFIPSQINEEDYAEVDERQTVEKNENNNGNSESEQVSEVVTMVVEDNQIIEATDPVILENTFDDHGVKLRLQIEPVSLSRTLGEEFERNENQDKKYSENTINQNGTFLKDFYYLYLIIKVENPEDGVGTFYVPNSLQYATVQDHNITMYSNEVTYQNSQYCSRLYAYKETDGKDLISNRSFIQHFNIGDNVEYKACYVVTEEDVAKNDICIVYPFGAYGERALKNRELRYIKINLQEIPIANEQEGEKVEEYN